MDANAPEPAPKKKPDEPVRGDVVSGEPAEGVEAQDEGGAPDPPVPQEGGAVPEEPLEGAEAPAEGEEPNQSVLQKGDSIEEHGDQDAPLDDNNEERPERDSAAPQPDCEAAPVETAPPPADGHAPSFLERSDYRVRLPVFNGPLDLLLYLIKRDEIDIHDIPIAHVAQEYVAFLDLMADWNINAAGDFLLMAATLMEIKSRMLLPEPPPLEEDEEEWEDPRAELVRQLMEYKRYKEAAMELADRAEERAMRYSRPGEKVALEDEEEAPPPVLGVDVWRLAEAFREILEATGADASHRVVMDETPQEVFMERLRRRVEAEGRVLFRNLFEGERHRAVLVGMFLALLELCRLFEVRAEQPEPEGDIWIAYVPPDQRGTALAPEEGEGEEEGPERPVASTRPWRFDPNRQKAPSVEFIPDEIDAELASIEVRDVSEAPPEPETVAASADEPGHEARAEVQQAPDGSQTDAPQEGDSAQEAAGPEESEAAAEPGGASPQAEESGEGQEDQAVPSGGEPPADEAETATVAIEPEEAATSDTPDADETSEQETQTVAIDDLGESLTNEPEKADAPQAQEPAPSADVIQPPAPEAAAHAAEPAGKQALPSEAKAETDDAESQGRPPLAAALARVRWQGLFGLCPCRYGGWLRVESADEGHVVLLTPRRKFRGMAVGVLLKAKAPKTTLELKGRVESCKRAAPRKFRLRVRLAPFGPEPGRNAPAGIKVLRELARTVGDSQ